MLLRRSVIGVYYTLRKVKMPQIVVILLLVVTPGIREFAHALSRLSSHPDLNAALLIHMTNSLLRNNA